MADGNVTIKVQTDGQKAAAAAMEQIVAAMERVKKAQLDLIKAQNLAKAAQEQWNAAHKAGDATALKAADSALKLAQAESLLADAETKAAKAALQSSVANARKVKEQQAAAVAAQQAAVATGAEAAASARAAAGFGLAMAARRNAVGQIPVVTDKASAGARNLQTAFQTFSLSLAGIPGPIGRLASSLSAFALGGAVTVAVVGGIALIAGAWEKFTRATREAKARTDELIVSLVKAAKERTGQAGVESRADLTKRIADLEAKLVQLRTPLPGFQSPGQQQGPLTKAQITRTEADLTAARLALAELERQVDKTDDALEAEISLLGLHAEAGKITAAEIDRLRSLEELFTAQLNSTKPSLEGRLALEERRAQVQSILKGLVKDALEEEIKLLQARVQTNADDSEALKRLAEIERDLVTQLDRKNLSLKTELELREKLAKVRGAGEGGVNVERLLRELNLEGLAPKIKSTEGIGIRERPSTFSAVTGSEFPTVPDVPDVRSPAKIALEEFASEASQAARELDSLSGALSGVESAFTGLFTDLITDFSNVGEALRSFGAAIAQTLARLAAEGFTSALISGIFGGASGKAEGGLVRGPGGPTSDLVPAFLSNGEGVLTARAMQAIGGESMLNYLNQLGEVGYRSRPLRLAEGGMVSPAASATISGQATVGLEEGLVLRHLETPAGERSILRVIQRKKNSVNGLLGR